ncbi:hypothetical protein PSTG_08181 [Puccinia striiformis f. sp. tritici PST-78]|uniref:Plectin/eS10 N-terminal domain-containing protein n=1 Tax=Puccinia striiformis f. sp. tritici PST-78 TaxID=1165861 RepID=A0A0L0VH76_9BASI|nr:hypothetical protein PSTG_08181 [Puccinia striiformis f. sp. tritici PST-78]
MAHQGLLNQISSAIFLMPFTAPPKYWQDASHPIVAEVPPARAGPVSNGDTAHTLPPVGGSRGHHAGPAPLARGLHRSRSPHVSRDSQQSGRIDQTLIGRMIIPKEDRRTIYENLFKDGVMVAKKDYDAPKHVELDVKNLFVIKACQSLNSRGFIKTQFSWKFYYYTLTDEGIEYLREWLNLPSEIVPATFKKVQRATPAGRPAPASGAYRPPRGEGGGDREGYRKKESGADGGFRPRFAGIGRGAPTGDAPAAGSW